MPASRPSSLTFNEAGREPNHRLAHQGCEVSRHLKVGLRKINRWTSSKGARSFNSRILPTTMMYQRAPICR